MLHALAVAAIAFAGGVAVMVIYVSVASNWGRIIAALRRQQSQPMMASDRERWRRMHLEADRRAASARKPREVRHGR